MEDLRETMLAALPAAAAIAVFGIIYGGLAAPEMGPGTTILSSVVIFSGSVQFTIAALDASGAATAAIVAGAASLNLRNLVLGAVLRPRIEGSAIKRGALGWFLTDEAAGLALTSKARTSQVLLVSGAMFYAAWQIGTVFGVIGASVDAFADAAAAVFPVLFVGLAAVACPNRSVAMRASVAAAGAGAAAWMWPGSLGVAAAVLIAIVVAIPGKET